MNKQQLAKLQSMVDDWRQAYSGLMYPTEMDFGKMDAFEQAADTLQHFIDQHKDVSMRAEDPSRR